ncbi:hypothetical protein U8P73_36355 (plasmid) [Rhizobium beringeri]|uniref:hypothetical protein n=1 Tax=Rhizobium beringeri TaxID=3019934 RepID=UPI002DDCD6B8|nr:hypothetical protein [Rhizobium beringeri]WSG93447.1 hypothetical protein U8P73_36355 [Rhizobium beringeri]
MNDNSKSLAELAAMKARGELTAEQFDDARKLLSPDVPPTRLNFRARQTPKKNGDGGKILLVLLIILGGLWSLGFLSGETPEEKERGQIGCSLGEQQEGGR